jgi:hypothetical protein
MELLSYILSQFVHCWCRIRLLIFVSWFCILLHCWSCLWCLGVLGGLWGIGSCHLQIGILWLLFYLSVLLSIISSCLIALARNSRTMLNRSGESGCSQLSCTPGPSWPNWGVTGNTERTNDRRHTCIKLGSGILGTWMEMYNSLITVFLYYSLLLLCFFSLLFKTFILLKTSFLFFKVSFLRLALSHVFS